MSDERFMLDYMIAHWETRGRIVMRFALVDLLRQREEQQRKERHDEELQLG